MDETTNQIKKHIEHKREDLQSNLQELETRMKSATDWRHQVRNHTGIAIAAAFGAGALIAALVGKGQERPRTPSLEAAKRSPVSGTKNEVLENWNTMKSALVGVAATKVKGMLAEIVPGFTDHLAKVEQNKDQSGNQRPSHIN